MTEPSPKKYVRFVSTSAARGARRFPGERAGTAAHICTTGFEKGCGSHVRNWYRAITELKKQGYKKLIFLKKGIWGKKFGKSIGALKRLSYFFIELSPILNFKKEKRRRRPKKVLFRRSSGLH